MPLLQVEGGLWECVGREWQPQRPSHQNLSLPAAAAANRDGLELKSGKVRSRWDRGETTSRWSNRTLGYDGHQRRSLCDSGGKSSCGFVFFLKLSTYHQALAVKHFEQWICVLNRGGTDRCDTISLTGSDESANIENLEYEYTNQTSEFSIKKVKYQSFKSDSIDHEFAGKNYTTWKSNTKILIEMCELLNMSFYQKAKKFNMKH